MPVKGDDFSQGYVPVRGDIVHLNWDPAIGHEMRGPHYGLVLSRNEYKLGTGMVVVAPITSKRGKLSGFEFPVRAGRVDGVAILSEFRTLDCQTRRIQYESAISANDSDEATLRVQLIF